MSDNDDDEVASAAATRSDLETVALVLLRCLEPQPTEGEDSDWQVQLLVAGYNAELLQVLCAMRNNKFNGIPVQQAYAVFHGLHCNLLFFFSLTCLPSTFLIVLCAVDGRYLGAAGRY